MPVTYQIDVTGPFAGFLTGTAVGKFGRGRVAKPLFLDPKNIAAEMGRQLTVPVNRRLRRPLMTPAPPRSDVKFVWSLNRAADERARRWWFRAVREGLVPTDGEHYRRSGTIPASWIITVSRDTNPITVIAQNPAEGSEFVYGSETQRQVPGHATTGWPSAKKELADLEIWMEEKIVRLLPKVADKLMP